MGDTGGVPETDLEHTFDKAREAFEALAGADIFITGGTGFFGKWLLETYVHACRRLKGRGSLTVLTRDPEAFKTAMPHLASCECLRFIEGDVRTFEFPDRKFTHIIHGATEANANVITEQPAMMKDVIIEGTRRMIEFAFCSGANRFLLTSSGAVYGRQPPSVSQIPEELFDSYEAMQVSSAYAVGKREAEKLCVDAAALDDLGATTARCFAFIGPHLPLDLHYAAGNFIRDGLAGKNIHVSGDGSPYRSYLHTADLAAWLWTILVRGGEGDAYNVGSDEAVTIGDLAARIASRFGVGVKIEGTPLAEGQTSWYVPRIKLARDKLGLDTWLKLDEAIERTTKWHLESKNDRSGP